MNGDRKFIYIIGGGVLFIVILIIVAVVVLGSGKKSGSGSSGPNTLTIWGTADDASAYNQIIKNYMISNSNVKILYVKKDAATYLNDALASIGAGKGPDILTMPSTWLPKYHTNLVAMPDNKIAQPKTKKTDVEVYQSTYPAFVSYDNIIDSKIYGMPMSGQSMHIYYNTTLFNSLYGQLILTKNPNKTDLGILLYGPKNWDEFVRASQLLTQKNGNTITQSGAALGTPNIANASDILTVLMEQNGAQMTSSDNLSAQFHAKGNLFGDIQYPGTKALSFYSSFANPTDPNYAWNDSLGDSVSAFANGKVAMMFGYDSQTVDIKRISPNIKYQTINLAQIKATANPVNFVSYNTLTVTKAAKDSASAWNFIVFATSKDQVTSYLTTTSQKSILSIKQSSNSTIATSKSWYVPDPEKTPVIFKQMIQTVNSGGNAQTAIENAAAQVTTLLAGLKQ